MSLSKVQKAIIVLSVLWVIICLLVAAGIADAEYSGFSKITFAATFFISTTPIWIYWAGVWIWGSGYIVRLFHKLFVDENQATTNYVYATLWLRTKACIWDLVPIVIIGLIFGAASIVQALNEGNQYLIIDALTGKVGKAIATILVILYLLYWSLADASKWQGTWGKRRCKICVIYKDTGLRIGYARSFLRTASFLISFTYFIAFIGFIVAAITKKRTTIHDALFATRVVCRLPEQSYSVAPVISKPSAYKWQIYLVLFLCWIITPLYLADHIYNFTMLGIGYEIGYALLFGIISLIFLIDARDLNTWRVIVHGLLPIILGANAQFHNQWDMLLAADDSKALELELKNATSENYIDLINASHTKLGKAISEAYKVNESTANKVISLLNEISCPIEECEKILKPESIRNVRKRKEILSDIRIKLVRSVQVAGEIDTFYDDAIQNIEKVNFPLDAPKIGYLSKYKESVDKVAPLQKAYAKSNENFYNYIVKLYEFLDNQSQDYYFDVDGKIMFSTQSNLDIFNLFRERIISSANQVDESNKKLLEAIEETQRKAKERMGIKN